LRKGKQKKRRKIFQGACLEYGGHIGSWITSPLASLRLRREGLPFGQLLLKIRAFFFKVAKGCKKKASVQSKKQDFMVYSYG